MLPKQSPVFREVIIIARGVEHKYKIRVHQLPHRYVFWMIRFWLYMAAASYTPL